MRIELAGVPKPAAGWSLEMFGKVGDTISQEEFEDGWPVFRVIIRNGLTRMATSGRRASLGASGCCGRYRRGYPLDFQ